jgi:hypothetical protein
MKIPKIIPLLVSAFPILCYGQTFTVLESFEDVDSNSVVDSVIPWNTERTEFFIHEANGDDDVLVSDGGKALEVFFSDALSGWGQDFQVLLSEDASQTLLEAWNSTDPHRYWVFYDITFQSGGGGWANNPFWIGGATYGDQVEANGTWDEPVPGYIGLDDAKNGNELVLTEDNRIALGFGFNGNLTDAGSVFVDNIRLLDTYAPGRGPSEVLLEGFEDENFDALMPSGFEVFPYSRVDDGDTNTTEGTKSARIEISESGWTTTSTLDLTLNDALNDILFELPQEERLNYILAYDYKVVPDPDVAVGWMQVIPSAAGLRLTPTWGGGANRTFSINLGTVPWEDPVPILNLITQGGFDGFIDLYVDNVRLINTQGAEVSAPTTPVPPTPVPPTPPVVTLPPIPGQTVEPPAITDIQVTADLVVLTFSSQNNGNYTILSTDGLSSDSSTWTEKATGVVATGGTSTWQESRSSTGAQFYLIRRN